MTLAAFKRSPPCPKCGGDGINFDYHPAIKVDEEDHRPSAGCGWTSGVHFLEHIHLTCARCAYGKGDPWIMAAAEFPRTVGFRRPPSSAPTDSTSMVRE